MIARVFDDGHSKRGRGALGASAAPTRSEKERYELLNGGGDIFLYCALPPPFVVGCGPLVLRTYYVKAGVKDWPP